MLNSVLCPLFVENLCSGKVVGVLDAVYGLARSYVVGFECLHVASGLLCTGKHRRCDTATLVGSTPKTFKDLRVSRKSASCPPGAMPAGMVVL